MQNYTFIEGCCGSGSITLYLCGMNKGILSYQGSKWKYRKQIEEIIQGKGFVGRPEIVKLYDPGPWSNVLLTLRHHKNEVITKLRQYQQEDPRLIYDKLQFQPIPINHIDYAADFLFLQRLSFSGKAVGSSSGIWNSPGFNSACAYGIKGTEKFGEVKPMIPSLIKNLETLQLNLLPRLITGKYLPLPDGFATNTVLYLDPPYFNSTKYPDGDLSRQEVIKFANAWHQAGAVVLVSEAEPLSELKNWKQVCISGVKNVNNLFRSKKEEWVTVSP